MSKEYQLLHFLLIILQIYSPQITSRFRIQGIFLELVVTKHKGELLKKLFKFVLATSIRQDRQFFISMQDCHIFHLIGKFGLFCHRVNTTKESTTNNYFSRLKAKTNTRLNICRIFFKGSLLINTYVRVDQDRFSVV